jgi:hypothetical protein
MRIRVHTAIIAILLGATSVAAFGDSLVVPNAQTTAPGNLPIAYGRKASRFQEVVGGGQFPGPIVITGARLRAATGTGPLSFAHTSYKVTLSTTQAYPNTNGNHTLPSAKFDDNTGPDAITVYDGPLAASSPGCAAPGPCPFDIVIPFSKPFGFDNKGRLLVDVVSSATTDPPVGSVDGVGFPDSTTSTVAIVLGDPASPTGALNLAGVVLELDSGSPNSLSGSFGFLIDAAFVDNLSHAGFSLLGVLNFDGAGNVSGTYTAEQGVTSSQPAQTATGTFTGSYSSNPDGTGTISIALDNGVNANVAMVITDGGKGLQLVQTSCTGSCDLSVAVVRGVARATYSGPLNGPYGFLLNSSPSPSGAVGVIAFDGGGKVNVSYKSVGVGTDPNRPPVSNGTVTGTYTLNPDGTGTIRIPVQGGQAVPVALAVVVTDGGSAMFLLQTDGTTDSSVSSGSARLQ